MGLIFVACPKKNFRGQLPCLQLIFPKAPSQRYHNREAIDLPVSLDLDPTSPGREERITSKFYLINISGHGKMSLEAMPASYIYMPFSFGFVEVEEEDCLR